MQYNHSVPRPDIKARGICGHGLTSRGWEMCYQTPFPMFLAGLEHLWVLSTFSTRSPSPPLLALLPFLVLSVCFWVQRFVCLHFPGLCRQLHTEPNSCHSSSPQISLHLFLAQNLIPCHPQWPRDLKHGEKPAVKVSGLTHVCQRHGACSSSVKQGFLQCHVLHIANLLNWS